MPQPAALRHESAIGRPFSPFGLDRSHFSDVIGKLHRSSASDLDTIQAPPHSWEILSLVKKGFANNIYTNATPAFSPSLSRDLPPLPFSSLFSRLLSGVSSFLATILDESILLHHLEFVIAFPAFLTSHPSSSASSSSSTVFRINLDHFVDQPIRRAILPHVFSLFPTCFFLLFCFFAFLLFCFFWLFPLFWLIVESVMCLTASFLYDGFTSSHLKLQLG